MHKTGLFCFLFFKVFFVLGQNDFKKPDPFSLNLMTWFETFGSFESINTKLENNGFQKIHSSNFVLGMEIGGIQNRNILKSQFYGTNIFKSKPKSTTYFQTVNVSIIYGYDLLPKSRKNLIYPLAGPRMHYLTVLSKRDDNTKIQSSKLNLESLFGFGFRHYLNDDFRGAINNIGIEFTISIPMTSSKWRIDGSEYILGTYPSTPIFAVTLQFGRAFFPAQID